MIIIFVFLRNLRATIIPGLAIPTSIVATFAIMYFLGFSINNFTLLALTLAIGIVVDDAIIVLENAYRHQEELGESPEVAATNGTREIGFAVIATTISLVAVFTPAGVPQGLHRPAVQRVRHRGGGLGGDLGLRGAHAHADALRQDPARAAAARGAVPGARERLQRARLGVRAHAARGDPLPLGEWWARWCCSRSARRSSSARSSGSSCRPRTRAGSSPSSSRPEGSSLAYTDGYQRQAEAVLDKTKDVESYFSVVNIGDGVSRGMIFTQPGGLRAADPLDPGHHRRGAGRLFRASRA